MASRAADQTPTTCMRHQQATVRHFSVMDKPAVAPVYISLEDAVQLYEAILGVVGEFRKQWPRHR